MTKQELNSAEERAKELQGVEIPNLDCLSVDPMDYGALSLVFGRLAAYAEYKMRAMQYRASGDIPAALSFEKGCEAQYAKLPAWAQW